MLEETNSDFSGEALIGGTLISWSFNNSNNQKDSYRDYKLRSQQQSTYNGEPLKPGTLLYECIKHPENLPVIPLNRILNFTNKHMIGFDGFSTYTDILDDAQNFFIRIRRCKSKNEAAKCVLDLKNKLEFRIKNSDIPAQYKDQFILALNPANYKDDVIFIYGLCSVILGFINIIFNSVNPVYVLTTSCLSAIIINNLFPDKHYLSTWYGPAVDYSEFKLMLAELNKLITQIENNSRPKNKI